MISVEHRLGKLVEIKFTPPVTMGDLEGFARDVNAATTGLAKVVFLVDFTGLHVLPEQEAQLMTSIMRTDNARVERSAYLLPLSAVAALQTERMIREAGNPMRRAFHVARKLLDWVGPSLDAAEQAAAQAFFAAHLPESRP
jgi:hypothetical protein